MLCFRDEQSVLNNKLAALEKKIIVGGENLLEKAEEQERMLEESAKELEERQQKAEELKKALQEKEVSLLTHKCIHLRQVWFRVVIVQSSNFLFAARTTGHRGEVFVPAGGGRGKNEKAQESLDDAHASQV